MFCARERFDPLELLLPYHSSSPNYHLKKKKEKKKLDNLTLPAYCFLTTYSLLQNAKSGFSPQRSAETLLRRDQLHRQN